MRRLAGLAILAASTPAAAQNTNCQWIGNVWSCNAPSQRGGGVDWNLARPAPNYNNQVMDAFRQGQQARQEQEYYRAQQQQRVDQAACRARMNNAINARNFELAKALSEICR